MGSTFGKNIKLSIFGESHGQGIGVVIDGFPSGLKIDETHIREELDRRKPGTNAWSTPRKEGDLPQVLSGIYKGFTTGAPIAIFFKNQDTRSQDYQNLAQHFRPSHADYTGNVRYDGFNDPRGGGHFSGRLTTGMVYAGAIMKQWLLTQGVEVKGHVSQVGPVIDDDLMEALTSGRGHCKDFPMFSESAAGLAKEEIERARMALDSIGAKLTLAAIGMPVGVGNPIFENVESHVASILYGVPAVKGVSFGSGFDLVEMRGSVANDRMEKTEAGVKTLSNHSGGISGGITSGMPIICHVAVKPTASIGMLQETWDGKDGFSPLQITGRHDPCIGPRALPVAEAMFAFALGDLLMGAIGIKSGNLKNGL